MRDDARKTETDDERRIVVVGPCASGKSTLVEGLVRHGYHAYAVAQEHSIVADLWRRRDPDVLIALDVALDVVRQRRSPTWSAQIYRAQHERLKPAFDAADIVIDTAEHDVDAALAISVRLLESTRP